MAEAAQIPANAAPVRWRRLPLRAQLLVLFLGFAVGPFLLAAIWGYVEARRLVADAAQLNLENVVAMQAAQLRGTAAEREKALRAAAFDDGSLTAALRALGAAEQADRESAARTLRAVLDARRSAAGFAELFALDASGRMLGGADAPSAPLKRACLAGAARVATLRTDGGAALLLSTPVRDASGVLVGQLCGRAPLISDRALAEAGRQRAMDARLALVGPQGELLASSAGPEPSAARGRSFLARAALPEFDASLTAALPEQVALAGVAAAGVKWAGAALLVAALLFVSIVVVARRVVRPLARLSSAAQRAAAGKLGERVSVEGPHELAELAHAFNRMSVALKASQGSLEQRVQERTRDLQASQDLSELLLNAIDQRVVVIGRDHRVVKANQAALKKYPGSLLGSSCHQLFEGRSSPCGDCPVSEAFRTGKVHADERTEGAGSLTEIVEVRAAPLFARDGSVEAVVRLARVVTAEKQLQAQMMYREKMSAFGLLAAGVAHEIGNPLASIESQLRLAREAPEPGRVERTLDVVTKEVARIASLLRDLVSFARRPRSEQTLVSLNQVVEDVTRLLSHDPRARSVTVERALAADIPGVRAKEDHLVQVLLNLGINALDAMPDGGTLEFSTCAEEEHAVVRVRDTGHGVPEAAQQHIFEPFFTTKDVHRGTGLGLFVSKSIVRDLKGHLALERTGAQGTTFCVRLPAARTGGRA